jgi:hypothetical protein
MTCMGRPCVLRYVNQKLCFSLIRSSARILHNRVRKVAARFGEIERVLINESIGVDDLAWIQQFFA